MKYPTLVSSWLRASLALIAVALTAMLITIVASGVISIKHIEEIKRGERPVLYYIGASVLVGQVAVVSFLAFCPSKKTENGN